MHENGTVEDLTDIPNIGPATAEALIAAGVPDAARLRQIGADEAYRALLRHGQRPHFIGYYVLQMALQGRPWNDCRGDEKAALRQRFDALVADTRAQPLSEIEAELDLLGLRAPAPIPADQPIRDDDGTSPTRRGRAG